MMVLLKSLVQPHLDYCSQLWSPSSQGQIDKAIADYDAAIELDGKRATALYGRGTAKLKKGDASGADDIGGAGGFVYARRAAKPVCGGVTRAARRARAAQRDPRARLDAM